MSEFCTSYCKCDMCYRTIPAREAVYNEMNNTFCSDVCRAKYKLIYPPPVESDEPDETSRPEVLKPSGWWNVFWGFFTHRPDSSRRQT